MIAQTSILADSVRKLCRKCNQEKPTSEFYPSYPSQCKACHYPRTLARQRGNKAILASRLRYQKDNPWVVTLTKINYRCNDSSCDKFKYYGGKGVKNFLTLSDLKFLWFRDKASNMKRASIDRIDSKGNYELDNCRYIEQSDNVKRLRPFSNDKIDEIRSYYRSGKFTQIDLANKYSVRQTTISNIVRKEHYSEV